MTKNAKEKNIQKRKEVFFSESNKFFSFPTLVFFEKFPFQAARFHSVPLVVCTGLYKLSPLFPIGKNKKNQIKKNFKNFQKIPKKEKMFSYVFVLPFFFLSIFGNFLIFFLSLDQDSFQMLNSPAEILNFEEGNNFSQKKL